MNGRSPSASACASYLMPRVPTPRGCRATGTSPAARASTASRILVYPVQRHRLPPIKRAALSRVRLSPTSCRLVEHRLGSHKDARRAEAALQCAERRKCIGHALTLIGVDCPRASRQMRPRPFRAGSDTRRALSRRPAPCNTRTAPSANSHLSARKHQAHHADAPSRWSMAASSIEAGAPLRVKSVLMMRSPRYFTKC